MIHSKWDYVINAVKGRLNSVTGFSKFVAKSKLFMLTTKNVEGFSNDRSSRQECSVKKVLLEIQNTCARVSFLMKLQDWGFWHRCFPVNFAKFLRTRFSQNTSGRLLLNSKGIPQMWWIVSGEKGLSFLIQFCIEFLELCLYQTTILQAFCKYLFLDSTYIEQCMPLRDRLQNFFLILNKFKWNWTKLTSTPLQIIRKPNNFWWFQRKYKQCFLTLLDPLSSGGTLPSLSSH